ncbi:MAG: hypothetical protein GDA38_15955 [Hormoscilla sp. SP12CHS1]|nr:hypothetical protein [Hormoscilla sp. SP12CHS1]
MSFFPRITGHTKTPDRIGVYSTKEAMVGLRQLKAIDRIPDPVREILG